MDTNKLNKWLSLVANVGVLLGLILVAFELQQNSELMRVQINQARADAAMVSNEHSFNSDYIPRIIAKIDSGGELSAEEWIRYVDYFRAMNRNQDNVLGQYLAGMLGENTPRSIEGYVREFIGRSDYSLKAWEITKHGYSDAFVEFVETEMTKPPRPNPILEGVRQ